MNIRKKSVESFLTRLYSWYIDNNRSELSWRQEQYLNAYSILVSEIMLQQTQVSRVIPYFLDWMNKYPTVEILAMSSLAEVLQSWKGLGYNNRGQRLQKAARYVIDNHHGSIPDSMEQLLLLPGVGHYTAGAIVAFAYNKPIAMIETNIRRVMIHEFFQDSESVHDRDILEILEVCIEHIALYGFDPRNFYWAMMDYGAYLKSNTQKNPNRKSAQYTKQSRFEGSFRQKRSGILQYILEMKSVTEAEILARYPDWSEEDREEVLRALQKDGLVRESGGEWTVL